MIPYIENFLTKSEADTLLEVCKALPATRPPIPRNKNVPRRKVSYGCYSVLPNSRTGMTVHGGGANYLDAAPDEIKSLQAKLSAYAGKEINYLSILGYEDEKDHIGWHQHREDRRKGHSLEDQSVWVISLGQIRELALRPAGNKDKSSWEYLYPAHGSLYVLPSSYNISHEHAILDRKYPSSLRISINTKQIDAKYIEAELAKLARKKPEPATKELIIATNGAQSIYCCRKNCEYPADAVYVGRKFGDRPDTPFGNHDKLNGDAWLDYVAEKMKSAEFAAQVESLRGKDLLCWCEPHEADHCHARAWLEIANGMTTSVVVASGTVPPPVDPPKRKRQGQTGYESRKVNAIGWCEKTWNVVVGCSRVSAGCDNCYAIPQCKRLSGNPKFGDQNPYKPLIQIKNDKLDFTSKLHFFEDRLEIPLHRKRPTVWFVNSLSDLYHHSLSLDDIKRIFAVMNKADWHTFQILTKRGDRMLEIADQLEWTPNIWQGVTFEGIPANMPEGQRKSVLQRIPKLLRHPAHIKFISFEPLVGPIPYDTNLCGIDWAFFGGESHISPPKARRMDLEWLRDGIALCQTHGVKPHVKQLGAAWAIASGTHRPPQGTDNGVRGKYPTGKISDVWPSDLRPYAIDSMREVTPGTLGESLLGAMVSQ